MMKKFNEYNSAFNPNELTENEILEMSNYRGEHFGIDGNVVLWIGSVLSSKHKNGNRIKVSNIPGKGTSDLFTITVPDLKVIGNVNTKHITTNKLNKIFEFIKLNEQLIIKFCQEEIDTADFLNKVKKI